MYPSICSHEDKKMDALEWIEQAVREQLREDGFAEAMASGNFADHVMYYVRGLVERRGCRLRQLILDRSYAAGGDPRQPSMVSFEMEMQHHDSLLERLPGGSSEKQIATAWIRQHRASGMFSYCLYKDGVDLQAYVLAAYIIVQCELLNFHPRVRNNPQDEQYISPLVEGISVRRAQFHIRDRTDVGCSSFYTFNTRRPHRLVAAGMAR